MEWTLVLSVPTLGVAPFEPQRRAEHRGTKIRSEPFFFTSAPNITYVDDDDETNVSKEPIISPPPLLMLYARASSGIVYYQYSQIFIQIAHSL